MSKTIIICDFDGTINKKDVSFFLLNRFTYGNWDGIDSDFISGKIGSLEAYRRVCDILNREGMNKYSYEDWLHTVDEQISLSPGFEEFLDYVFDNGWRFVIVSDGFDFYIERILSKNILDKISVYSNHLEVKKGRVIMDFPNKDDECTDCGTCKRNIVRKFKMDGFSPVIYIGDGYSDRCGAGEADIIFSRRELIGICIKKGWNCFYFKTFKDILKTIKKRLRGLIFDFDGTVIDSFEPLIYSMKKTLSNFNIFEIDEDKLKRMVGTPLKQIMIEYVGERNADNAIKIFRDEYSKVYLSGTKLINGLKDTFEYLKNEGLVLCVASNKFGRFTRDLANHLNIAKYLSAIVGEGDGYPIKPKPDMIISVLNLLNLNPDEVYYVGDTSIDREASNGAGIQFIAVPDGSTPKEELTQLKADVILSNVNNLKWLYTVHSTFNKNKL